ncbi:MAG TPA: hypothetical protein VG899_08675 [Mycobacteriales bacterium]|nr:hypothetical protein [Mycobacteriales bacterium]
MNQAADAAAAAICAGEINDAPQSHAAPVNSCESQPSPWQPTLWQPEHS